MAFTVLGVLFWVFFWLMALGFVVSIGHGIRVFCEDLCNVNATKHCNYERERRWMERDRELVRMGYPSMPYPEPTSLKRPGLISRLLGASDHPR